MVRILSFGLLSTVMDGTATVTAPQCRDSPHMPGCSPPAQASYTTPTTYSWQSCTKRKPPKSLPENVNSATNGGYRWIRHHISAIVGFDNNSSRPSMVRVDWPADRSGPTGMGSPHLGCHIGCGGVRESVAGETSVETDTVPAGGRRRLPVRGHRGSVRPNVCIIIVIVGNLYKKTNINRR